MSFISGYVSPPVDDPNVNVRFHAADYNRDYRLNVTEMLRVVELYSTMKASTRTGCYKEDPDSVDGFAPDPTRDVADTVEFSRYHDCDFTKIGSIDINGLTRAIQIYNYADGAVRTGEYHVWNQSIEGGSSEDGFVPGPVRVP